MIPRPVGPRVLVKLFEDGQIWVPTGAIKTLRGAVVDTGEDVRFVMAGDEIVFIEDQSWEIRHEDEKYFVMPESSVLLILDRLEAAPRADPR